MQRTIGSVAFAAAVGVAIAALVPSRADAQRPGGGTVHFDLHASFPGWYGAVGGGGRVDITLTPQGVINNADDELTLSLGADMFWFWWTGYQGFGIMPLAVVQWNFFLNREWDIFPELGLAFIVGPGNFNHDYYGTYIGPAGGFGVRYHFSESVALLLRVAWPAGIEIGVSFL